MSALRLLHDKNESGFHVCVGLDTDIRKIPKHLLSLPNPVLEFNKIVIDATAGHAAAYKINLAFYEAEGIPGLQTMMDTIAYINKRCFIIGDAKRADIGNSSAMYAKSLFDYYGFDSITVPPYMGFDSLNPFFEYQDKLIYILGLTSNPGSADVQKQVLTNGQFVYTEILKQMQEIYQTSNCGVVFGATNSKELESSLNALEPFDILLPGIGSQGGKLEDVIPVLYSGNHKRFLINVSRSLLYGDGGEDFGEYIKREIKNLNQQVLHLSALTAGSS